MISHICFVLFFIVNNTASLRLHGILITVSKWLVLSFVPLNPIFSSHLLFTVTLYWLHLPFVCTSGLIVLYMYCTLYILNIYIYIYARGGFYKPTATFPQIMQYKHQCSFMEFLLMGTQIRDMDLLPRDIRHSGRCRVLVSDFADFCESCAK